MSDDRKIENLIYSLAERGEPSAIIAYAILQLATAQAETAMQLKYLGNGNATDQFGAIEAFGMHIGEKLDRIAEAMEKDYSSEINYETIGCFLRDGCGDPECEKYNRCKAGYLKSVREAERLRRRTESA